MELREPIEFINKRLMQEFGKDLDGRARFRVVFSEDQYEKRWTRFTKEGFELLEPTVVELPKYKQYIHQKYILEALTPVEGESDLVEEVVYEPIWTFQDKNGNYLPPFYDGCKFLIEVRYASMGRSDVFDKYKDESISKEARMAEIERVEKELFGNETEVGDALAYGSGVGFTTSKLLQ